MREGEAMTNAELIAEMARLKFPVDVAQKWRFVWVSLENNPQDDERLELITHLAIWAAQELRKTNAKL